MIENLEARLAQIEARNARVEDAKAWETSLTRRASISLLTYCVVLCVVLVIRADRPWLGALVPVAGFLLSTQSLPVIRKLWHAQQASQPKP